MGNDATDPEPSLLGQDEADIFLKLSALLTGTTDLDPVLAEDFRTQLEPAFGPAINVLCGLYYDIIAAPNPVAALLSRIGGDEQFLAAARQIASTWMLTQFYPDPTTKKPQLAGHFERGLLWRVIDAHPPAFSAARHGYWATRPEEL
ncbi:sugar dehydrogenase complex small subunit [Nocardia nepalensis]|uniref:sugar dehydrogenase complex small subunit n=1 Tax=Nocardia nepalensis TaxID=3375448 RepID=UPI003B67026E